jgi:hypothetical protein
MAKTKKTIDVPREKKRELAEAPIAAVIELTPEQQRAIKTATGRDIPRLELTKLEIDLVTSAAGYDAPGAGTS